MPRLELRIQGIQDRRGTNPFTGEGIVVPGRPESSLFFEAELRGNVVHYANGGLARLTRLKRTEFESEDEAYFAYASSLAAKRRRGFVEVGCAREIEGTTPEPPCSSVLLDVYYSAGDPRFLEELLRERSMKRLGALAPIWFEDKRPFARQMLLAYVEDGFDRPNHKALVKRLFKRAESSQDHELMARFLVAFDRWNRRTLQTVGYRWDPDNRTGQRELGLREDPLVPESLEKGRESSEFSRVTRRYLVRRALRYFRRFGYRDAGLYRKLILEALLLYREEHTSSVGRLLSAWGLMHVLYGRSTLLLRHPRGIRLAPKVSLADLSPAPLFPEAWVGAFGDLLRLLADAGSRTVRAWALAMLRQGYAEELAQLEYAAIKTFLFAKNDEAQALGVQAFRRLPNLDALSVEDWLALLAIDNLEVLAEICERATTSFDGSALTLAQCVQLALSAAAPLARLGFDWCRTKAVATPNELAILLGLRQARVESVRKEAAMYCGELLQGLPFATMEQVRDFCDSAHRDVRSVGLATAVKRFADDVDLWTALGESPYADVRSHVVEQANHFRGSHPGTLQHVFGTVLLSLQGAAKDKRRVAREIVACLAAEPARASSLLPLLRASLRSIHPAERGFALGALAQITVENAALRALASEEFPEFSLVGTVSE